VRRIADSLRVSNILEGSLQKIGSRLRLQVRLVEARDGSTRWSEVYDREMQDLFATEDDIASAVARELAVRLEGAPHHPAAPPDPEHRPTSCTSAAAI